MIQINNVSLKELKKTAVKIINEFNEEKIFVLQGPMGSGKTTLIKLLCETLGVSETVTSPTFALINEYRNNNSDKLYHFDFYRINSQSEAFDFGYEEYFFSGSYCFIEWPEKIENLLPEKFVKISIDENQDGTRNFNVVKINFSS